MADLDILKILSRDTINVEGVEKTLKYASVRNFETLYSIQEDVVGSKRYDVSINDLELVTRLSTESYNKHYPHRYGYTIQTAVITDECKRKCKENGLYGKALSQKVISENRAYITHNFLMFIDGKFIDTGEMVIDNCQTTIILDVNPGKDANEILQDGIPMEDYLDYCERDCTVTIFLVPNFYYAESRFNMATLDMVLKRNVPASRFSNTTEFDSQKTIFYMNTSTSDMSTMVGLYCDVDKTTMSVKINSDISITNNRLKISAITLDDIYEIKTIEPGGDTWFMLSDDMYNSPLPVDNIIPFVEKNGQLYFDCNVRAKLYYPNIYQITNVDPESKVYLYILYKYTVDAKYNNELEILRLLSGDLLNRYKIDSLPEFVKNYKPTNITWLEDAEEYRSSTSYPERLLYDINALANIALSDRHILLKYLSYRLDFTPRYYVTMNKLDLTSRVRMDTCTECEEAGEIIRFNEPNYVFSLKRRYAGTYSGIDFRIFIDGKFINPELYAVVQVLDMYHFYIPTRFINENSVMELEKYREYRFTKDLNTISTDTPIKVTIPKNIRYIYTHDITIIDKTTHIYLRKSLYNITAYSDIMKEEITLNQGEYSIIKDYFNIEFSDTIDTSHEYAVMIDHTLTTRTYDLDVTDYRFPLTISIPNYKNILESDIRAFAGDLLLPEQAYAINNNGKHLRDADISFYVDFEKIMNPEFTHVTIDELPTGIKKEFKLDYIDNEYGFVDTGEKLSLPLDLKWYDIYVNGVKLHKYNVDIITSNKFFIKGVESRKNLVIYARGDIYNEFNFIHRNTIENKLFDDIESIYNDLLIDRDIIQDTLDDITEGLLLELGLIYEFYADVLQYRFINPNESQIDEDFIDAMTEYESSIELNEFDIMWLDCNTSPDAIMFLDINSNRRDDIMKNGQYRFGFTPLYLGNHDDAMLGEYMCDPVTGDPGMVNEDGTIISTGVINRLSSHKDKFDSLLASYNLQNMSIYHIEPTDNTHSKIVTKDSDLIEESVELDGISKKLMVSIDMDILEVGYMNVMQHSAYMPKIEIAYTMIDSNEINTITLPLRDINNSFMLMAQSPLATIDHIKLLPESDGDTMSGIKCILHSVLVAF